MRNDGCQAPIPPFSSRLGLYIEGSVSPPTSDVHIRIIAAGDSHSAPINKGDLALETTTGMDGAFTGGPLYDDTTYKIDASKVSDIHRRVYSFFFIYQCQLYH